MSGGPFTAKGLALVLAAIDMASKEADVVPYTKKTAKSLRRLPKPKRAPDPYNLGENKKP